MHGIYFHLVRFEIDLNNYIKKKQQVIKHENESLVSNFMNCMPLNYYNIPCTVQAH